MIEFAQQNVDTCIDSMNRSTINIGIVGESQFGKSTLINCLLQSPYATIGRGMATTHSIVRYVHSDEERIEYYAHGKKIRNTNISILNHLDTETDIEEINVFLNIPILKDFTFFDMPGFWNDNSDNRKTLKFLQNIDFAIWITTNSRAIGGEESQLFKIYTILKKYNIPYYIVLNCTESVNNKWDPSDEYNLNIAEVNFEKIFRFPPISFPYKEREHIIVNLIWYWFAIRGKTDSIIKGYLPNIKSYGLEDIDKSSLEEASNFKLIKNIFSMDNKMYLELRKEFKDEIQKVKDELCPVGAIQAFAFTNLPPEGWLLCNGAHYLIDDYPLLFEAIGDVFCNKDTPDDHFCVPNLQGQFIRGWDRDGEIDENREFGSSQEDALQEHVHSFITEDLEVESSGSHSHTTYARRMKSDYNTVTGSTEQMVRYLIGVDSDADKGSTSENGNHTHQIITKGNPIGNMANFKDGEVRSANETRPKNIALLYCIKAK